MSAHLHLQFSDMKIKQEVAQIDYRSKLLPLFQKKKESSALVAHVSLPRVSAVPTRLLGGDG